ncbi:MAG: ABC transporter permease [Acidobacteriaceae bacterium]
MNSLLQDLGLALRQFRRAPLFTAIAVLTLALGIGACTAIFSLVDSVLLRPLAYPNPSQLVYLTEGMPKMGFNDVALSAPDFLYLQQHDQSFSEMAVYQNQDFELSGSGNPQRIVGARISSNLFSVLGISPALGRAFTGPEDQQHAPVAILSFREWQQRFAADPTIIGRTVTLDRLPRTVVGVAPKGFDFPAGGPGWNGRPAAFFVPISFSQGEITGFGNMFNNSVIARLKPGVSMAQAQSEVSTLIEQFSKLYPAEIRSDPKFSLAVSVTPLREQVTGNIGPRLLLLQVAVFLLLVIACVDIANLFLARATGRQREMAIRASMGATRMRLIRQLTTEALAISGLGLLLGLVLASAGIRLLLLSAPADLPRASEIGIHPGVFAFSVALALLTTLLTGVAPALRASRVHISEGLREGTRGGGAGKQRHLLLGGLVAAQFAIALLVVVIAGLLIRSYLHLMQTDPGFEAQNVLTMSTTLPIREYSTAPQIRSFYEDLLQRAAAIPGTRAAGLGTSLPLNVTEHDIYSVEGASQSTVTTAHTWTIGDYFGALGVSLLHGRFFTPADRNGSQLVILINQTFARKFFPHTNPLGHRLKAGTLDSKEPWKTIVGVVADVKSGPLQDQNEPETYSPFMQEPDSSLTISAIDEFRSLSLVLRTSNAPESAIGAARAVFHDLDPSLPVTDIHTMSDRLSQSLAPQRFHTLLLTAFGLVALLLAAAGIGGVLGYSVAQRTREIGVRMALGASRGGVMLLVLRQGITLAALGCGIGVVLCLFAARAFGSMLYQTTTHDVLSFSLGILVLAVVAVIACSIPARRASSVNPVDALRQE